MYDYQLFQAIINVLNTSNSAYGVNALPVLQSNQPTLQGINTAPSIYLQKIGGDKRFGFTGRADVWDTDTSQMNHTETQQYESTFQLSALVKQNPAVTNQLTASDIVNGCAAVLSSTVAIDALQAASIGLYRILNVRNPFFQDDYDQWEASPSFDFTLTHKQIIETTTPIITETVFQVEEV